MSESWKNRLGSLVLVCTFAVVLSVCNKAMDSSSDGSKNSSGGIAYADFKPSDISAVMYCRDDSWDTGVHTALIARWPGTVPVGVRTDAMVQFADVLPTLLDVAGSTEEHSADFDGRSFINVLKGKSSQHRKFVYGVHNNVPEGPPYPVRTVSDGTYRYVRNLLHGNLYIEKHLMGVRGDGLLNNPYWQTWVWDSWESPETYTLVQRYMNRPAEALYHTASDPYELKNLIGTDSTKETLSALSRELDRWLVSQGDPGIEQDTPESHRAAKRGEHRFRAPTVDK